MRVRAKLLSARYSFPTAIFTRSSDLVTSTSRDAPDRRTRVLFIYDVRALMTIKRNRSPKSVIIHRALMLED